MIIINGKRYGVAGFAGMCFLEDPALILRSRHDWRPRPAERWIRGLVLHTRMGLPVTVRPGKGPNLGWDTVLARRFSDDERQASAHIAIDADGSYACLADLRTVCTYHAGHVNEITVGIEMYQGTDGMVCESTLESCLAICDVLTRALGIQRQYPLESVLCRRLASPTPGLTPATKLAYMKGGGRGQDFVGVYGHRNVTANRGPGDPGDPIFQRLGKAGYEGYRIDDGDDLAVWAERQSHLGIDPEECNGIPDRKTRDHINLVKGKRSGLWVTRPGDDDPDTAVT
jgi:N-acetylmuramoyl-L-alanine amidase